MHIRPVYWLLLLICCLSTFGFACVWQEQVPAMLRVQVVQQESAEEVMVVIHLTDAQGLPLDEAHVVVSATMPAMTMPGSLTYSVQRVKIGCYQLRLRLPMDGEWLITSSAELAHFVTSTQRLLVSIPSSHLPGATSPRPPSLASC